MTNPVLFRDATTGDLDSLVGIARNRAQHADRLRDADGGCLRYLVAIVEGRVAGFGLLVFTQPPTWPPIRRLPCMIDLFVAPELRGRGIGTEMIGFMEQAARNRGFHEIVLSVDPEHNTAAKRLYLRLGYVPLQKEPYLDHWRYTDSAGVAHEGQEMLIDLRKDFDAEAGAGLTHTPPDKAQRLS